MNTFLTAMLNGWWQGLLLTLLVWLVLRDLPRLSAATRLAIWQLTLAVVILLPLLQRIPLSLAAFAVSDSGQSRPLVELPADEATEGFLSLLAILALAGLLRLAIGYLGLRRLKRKAEPAGLAAPVRIGRPTEVLISDRVAMPMAVGYRSPAILLPRAMAERLNGEELHHVLMHESAHLVRRDDWMTLAERIAGALFFFQPAVACILRQIEREREMACDDWVVAQQAVETRRYASSLARVAELGSDTGSFRMPLLATGAGRPKAIFARLETLLDRTRNRLPGVSEPFVMIAGLAILLAAYQGSHFNHLFGFGGGYTSRWAEHDATERREIKMRGEIHFAPDDADVESMSPGAQLVVEHTAGWRKRAVEFAAGDDGLVTRRYFDGARERPFDAEARRFVAKILQGWVREQGIDIPERLARTLRQRGAEAALEDLRAIRGAHVKRRYLEEYFVQAAPLTPWQLNRALRVAAEMDSDHEKKQFLEAVGDRYEGAAEAQVLSFIDSIQGEHERSELLARAIDRGSASVPARVVRSIGRLSSDDAKARLLIRAAEAHRALLPPEFFEAAGSIQSDDARERVLAAALGWHGDEAGAVMQILRAAVGINSDHHKANVAAASARHLKPADAEAMREAGRLLTSIHSANEKRRALEPLLEASRGQAAAERELLLAAMTIDSDDEKAKVLQRAAAGLSLAEPARRAFFTATASIHSSRHLRQVLLAVLARTDVDKELAAEVSRASVRLESREDRDAVLSALAGRG